MAETKRIYVEKKSGFDIESEHIFFDLKYNVGISNIEHLRIINCYDIQGLDNQKLENSKNTIFSEPPVDYLYQETFPHDKNDFIFGVKYLPGQYDQRADSAMQCIKIDISSSITDSNIDDDFIIETSKFFVIKGNLNEEDKSKIKDYCINPVDSMEVFIEKPKDLKINMDIPNDIEIFRGFIEKSDNDIIKFKSEIGLAMSDNDLIFCRNYFRDIEKRNPTETEIRVIDTYWSDHCRHTTFLTKIENVVFEDGKYKNLIEDTYKLYINERKNVYGDKDKDICLMDIAVMGMKALKKKGLLQDLDESEEINACSIVVNVDVNSTNEEWLIMFKNETHNHPTEIEPFGGAATCLGGAIRDPLSGRSYVYQAMRVTGSGNVLTPVQNTISGKLPQRKISQGAANGYSSYGNQIGLATGLVKEIYDDGYIAKRMEIGAVVGAVKKEHVIRERPQKGDIVILVGGRTGRDGCGGATGSSKEHDEDSILTCGAEVQKGNAPTERKLQRFFRNPDISKMIKRCNDFGAGGVSVAIGELADGLKINLDSIPKKYDGLNGTELAISESQERMAIVTDKNNGDLFIKKAHEENLEAVIVATVTDDRRLQMFWRDNNIVNISRDFLDTNGAKQHANVKIKNTNKIDIEPKNINDLKSTWINTLADLNVASQKGLSEIFDSTVGSNTVLMPFGGKYQLTPEEVMAAKIPVGINKETKTATIMSYGYNPVISKQSPFHGASLAVVESVSKIVASGGKYNRIRLTFQEYFEKLGADPEKWGKPFSSLLGAFYSQMNLNIPSIGGKDSMSGTFKDLNVPPTLVSFAITTSNMNDIISNEFKKADNFIMELRTPVDSNDLPVFDTLTKNYEIINKAIVEKKIISANVIGYGGLCAALSKMSFGNKIGFEIEYNDVNRLFKEDYGSFVLEMDCDTEEIENIFIGLDFNILGKTNNTNEFKINNIKITIEEALESWLSTFENIFPTNMLKPVKNIDIPVKLYDKKPSKIYSGITIAKPRVFLPVFPGTNCEMDMASAFEKAGAITEIFVFKNLDYKMLEESIQQMIKLINNSQIIALSGGFSAGDEPEGSGKFIASVFRNSYIKEAVMNMLNIRDGLMIGICNGFQALIKLGLVPYGEIIDITKDSPTLTFNEIGRHTSCLINTKVISKISPWFNNVELGDIHTIPISNGEGRFVASEDMIKQLAQNGQIATQYVDLDGNPTYDIKYNPNGSMFAIESITSADGRVLGKMGHSERIGEGVYKNIININSDQKLFESGVKYFS